MAKGAGSTENRAGRRVMVKKVGRRMVRKAGARAHLHDARTADRQRLVSAVALAAPAVAAAEDASGPPSGPRRAKGFAQPVHR